MTVTVGFRYDPFFVSAVAGLNLDDARLIEVQRKIINREMVTASEYSEISWLAEADAASLRELRRAKPGHYGKGD